jgi:endonuclease III
MTVTNKNIDEVIRLLKTAVKELPDPSVTLVGKRWRDPFLVLVSCLLSLRTKDETTLPAAQRLFALGQTPEQILSLSEQKIEKAIYPVGFYRTKARTIKNISRELIEKYNGKVPDDMEALLSFKGVGRKTANLVMTEGFGQPAICVDTHVHRISNRMGFVRSENPLQTEMMLRQKLPRRYWIEYNAILVTWGQNICRPVSPWCSRCPIRKHCARIGVQQSR